MIGVAIWGGCFLTGLVYLLASLKTFREERTR